ncbi:MAG: outer membrane lipoprotein carrier protein LolA [Bacteroidetes bacterium]|nr:outer membrane lipoprotein carrier protein LolA [Bacteroidota bacterium]
MMKKILMGTFLITAVTFCNYSFAQNDANAKKILDKVSANIKTIPALKASFTYITQNKNKSEKNTESGILYMKGNKYYFKRGVNEIFSNGIKTWNYNGNDEVIVENVDASDEEAFTPQKFLSDFYEKEYTYQLISSSGDYYTIQLTPIDKRKNFKQVYIYINKSKNLVTKAKIWDKAGNTIDFTLSNIDTKASLPDSKFVFDTSTHPGVEVITQ